MGDMPFIVYDRIHAHDVLDRWTPILRLLPAWLRQELQVEEYALRATNLAQHIGYQARGATSGLHGLLHQ